tara:strand:- start:66 stop:245 length:180 start_codon:yes stop_codon:yes gene_type:complete
MEVFIILISAIFTAGIVVLILMYFGYIKDNDKDGIPDVIEHNVEELRKEIKKKIAKKKK